MLVGSFTDWARLEALARRSAWLLVALGNTAARSLFGKAVSVGSLRDQVCSTRFGTTLVGPHPASILRSGGDIEPLVKVLRHARELSETSR